MPLSKQQSGLQIFLSYASEDNGIVWELYHQLREDGFKPWFDEVDLLPGQLGSLEIEKSMRSSDVVLLCFSSKSIGSAGSFQREFKRALDIQSEKPEGSIFIIPIRLDDCEAPPSIRELQQADYPAEYNRLLKALQSRAKTSSIQQPLKKQQDRYLPPTIEGPTVVKPEWAFNDLTFRQEFLLQFYGYVKSYESFYILGGSSVGKSRLFEFMKRTDVHQRYLGEQAEKTWLVRINPIMLTNPAEPWMFYELMINSLLRASDDYGASEELKSELANLDALVLDSQDLTKALRFFDLVVNKICQMYDLKLCFFFDEADDLYKRLPREVFDQLRYIRDGNKYRVLYILFFRDLPERLKLPAENLSFYELIARNRLGLGPYSKTDALKISVELEDRRNFPLPPEVREKVYEASAGHQALALAILITLIRDPSSKERMEASDWLVWLGEQEYVQEECKKIWDGLKKQDQRTLRSVAEGELEKLPSDSLKLLMLKGLLLFENGMGQVFCPLLKEYILSLEDQTDAD